MSSCTRIHNWLDVSDTYYFSVWSIKTHTLLFLHVHVFIAEGGTVGLCFVAVCSLLLALPVCVSWFGAPSLGTLCAVLRGWKGQQYHVGLWVPDSVASPLPCPASSDLHGEAGCPRIRSLP